MNYITGHTNIKQQKYINVLYNLHKKCLITLYIKEMSNFCLVYSPNARWQQRRFLLRIAEEVRDSRFETSSLFPIVFCFIVLDHVQLMNMYLSLGRSGESMTVFSIFIK